MKLILKEKHNIAIIWRYPKGEERKLEKGIYKTVWSESEEDDSPQPQPPHDQLLLFAITNYS